MILIRFFLVNFAAKLLFEVLIKFTILEKLINPNEVNICHVDAVDG